MLLKLKKVGYNTFSSLKKHNFRLYFIGQIISVPGGWMQNIALSWLVLQLTNSGTALGVVAALQYFPILLLSPFAGSIIDKFSKRKILYITQSVSGVLAIILGYLTIIGEVRLWMIFLIALLIGFVNTVDIPTRQVFVSEMVGEDELKNAITLNSMLMNLSRIVGPTIAGIVIVTAGIGPCFIVNGISFLAFIFVVFIMRSSELHKARKSEVKGRLFEGFYYIISKPTMKVALLLMMIMGTLSYEFSVSLALLAQKTFHGDARDFAGMLAIMGVGAIFSGMISARSKKIRSSILVGSAFFFGFFIIGASIAPNIAISLTMLLIVGFFSLSFMTAGSATMQLNTPPELRGRVMVFWTMAFSGSTAVGGPIIGWVGQHLGPRWGLGVGGFAAVFAAVLGMMILERNGIKFFVSEKNEKELAGISA